jgi:hypothetical protein
LVVNHNHGKVKLLFRKIDIISCAISGSQTIQNQQPFIETTTIAQNVNRFQGLYNLPLILPSFFIFHPGLQNPNTDLNQVFAFQPKQWQGKILHSTF